MKTGWIPKRRRLLARLAVTRLPAAGRRSACCALGLLAAALPAAEPPADLALGPAGRHPVFLTNAAALAAGGLAASAAEGRLRAAWTPPAPAAEPVTLWTSTDAPGHWPSRDWRPVTMTRQGGAWTASLPLRSATVPVVYFAQTAGGVTPPRIFHPARAGVAEPPAAAWTFLEGFEEEPFPGWELASAATNAVPLARDAAARSGRWALAVTIPPGRASVAVATTRLRGWMLREHAPAALRLAARAPAGGGELRLALHMHAGTPELAISEAAGAAALGPGWRGIEAPFSAFPRLRAGAVDRLVLEFRGAAGQRLLLDDVELSERP